MPVLGSSVYVIYCRLLFLLQWGYRRVLVVGFVISEVGTQRSSRSFFRQFIPRNRYMSMLFLRFQERVCLRVVPFKRGETGLVRQPIFGCGLVTYPQSDRLSVSFFCLGPSIALIRDASFSQVRGANFHFHLRQRQAFFRTSGYVFQAKGKFCVRFYAICNSFRSFNFGSREVVLVINRVGMDLSVRPSVSIFQVVVHVVDGQDDQVGPCVQPIQRDCFQFASPVKVNLLHCFQLASLCACVWEGKGRSDRGCTNDHGVTLGAKRDPRAGELFLVFRVRFGFVFEPFRVFDLSPFDLLALLRTLRRLFPMRVCIQHVVSGFDARLFPGSPGFFVRLPILVSERPLLRILFVDVKSILFRIKGSWLPECFFFRTSLSFLAIASAGARGAGRALVRGDVFLISAGGVFFGFTASRWPGCGRCKQCIPFTVSGR